MRRDDRDYDPSEGAREIDAVAAQWTRKWEELGGPKPELENIKRREEYAILDAHVRHLPQGARLFDAGCGMGAWTVHYTRRGYPTYGIDVSQPTIDALRKVYPDMEFVLGDIRDTGLPANSVDVYFSWGTMEHFEEGFSSVVGEALRVLKPGGVLLTSMPFDNLRHSIAASLRRGRNVSANPGKTRFYQWRLTRRELADTLARYGFDVEDVKIIHKPQGALRWVQNGLGLPPKATITRGLAYGLSLALPAVLIGHMVLAVARKPSGTAA